MILRELGSLPIKHIRGEDVACRYGGDEFIIILPDIWQEITRERAEILCEHARHINVQFEGQTRVTITLSLGVVVFPEDGSTSAILLRSADAALYRAKHEGSNRVVVSNHRSHRQDILQESKYDRTL